MAIPLNIDDPPPPPPIALAPPNGAATLFDIAIPVNIEPPIPGVDAGCIGAPPAAAGVMFIPVNIDPPPLGAGAAGLTGAAICIPENIDPPPPPPELPAVLPMPPRVGIGAFPLLPSAPMGALAIAPPRLTPPIVGCMEGPGVLAGVLTGIARLTGATGAGVGVPPKSPKSKAALEEGEGALAGPEGRALKSSLGPELPVSVSAKTSKSANPVVALVLTPRI